MTASRPAASLPQIGFARIFSKKLKKDTTDERSYHGSLVMLVVCAMALTHPVWQYWYQKIFPPLCIIMMILALDYVLRK